MSEYQPSARRFRPQIFSEVFGQEVIVTTLKNAIKGRRLANAYLFCGSRGTGKTTLARLFAKALNCLRITKEGEPCNACISCKEITAGSSLDVLEIDGASHRGIEDVRQINETAGYAAAAGGYKIYLIDEVHMLTKEAFNALLKIIEEPPAKVKFLFATTEPHKIPATILSRCQRFNLSRISIAQTMGKLRYIATVLEVDVQDEALLLLAQRSEGGLRDAESLFDQILAFGAKTINSEAVLAILGITAHSIYFEIDRAGQAGDFIKAFKIAEELFSLGKDLFYFMEGLVAHLRQILLCQLSGLEALNNFSNEQYKEHYLHFAKVYSKEQCLDLIEYLLDKQQQMRLSTFGKFLIETIILHVMRSHFSLPIEYLVRRLTDLEQAIQEISLEPASNPLISTNTALTPINNLTPIVERSELTLSSPQPMPAPILTCVTLSEDPTPNIIDFDQKPKMVVAIENKVEQGRSSMSYDTLFQFSAVELEGRLQKHH